MISYCIINADLKLLTNLDGKELEEYGSKIFHNIGLKCYYHLGQVKVCDIIPGALVGEHIEFDYIIPHNNVCLIGEITARKDKRDLKNKYQKFIEQINKIKSLSFSTDLWLKLGVKQEYIQLFREVEDIKAFFITTQKEKYDLTLPHAQDIAIFYQSDFLRIIEYSKTIGKWGKNYFLNNFNIKQISESSINIIQNNSNLIINRNKKVSSQSEELADLYTFTISPYKLLYLAHVCRKDELPNLEKDNSYNYQRLLNSEKLQIIRKEVLTNSDFIFPSSILAILSKECTYTKDGLNKNFLYIPNKYGSLYIVDGQHRLFAYANEKVESVMTNDCKIEITVIDFHTKDEYLIRQISAKLFIEINANQTKVEFSHLDQIAYEVGSEEPKVIATTIIVRLNEREKYRAFFNVNSDKINRGLIEAGLIINALKKITNINEIKKRENAQSGKVLLKKQGYESLFDCDISELSNKNILVEKGVILLEKYFNEIFYVFKEDKLALNKKTNTSFRYSKFWAGFINLLYIFMTEGLDWEKVKEEIEKIKSNLMKLQGVSSYNQPLFNPSNEHIPDFKYTPTEVCKFLNENRQQDYSIQNIK